MFKLHFIYIYLVIHSFIYSSIYLSFITDCCTYHLRLPRLAPAICGRKWTQYANIAC